MLLRYDLFFWETLQTPEELDHVPDDEQREMHKNRLNILAFRTNSCKLHIQKHSFSSVQRFTILI